MDWKSEAKLLYKNNVQVSEIAKALKLSRKTVSKFLNTLEDKAEIKEQRKSIAFAKRKKYKKEYEKDKAVTAYELKRQHEIDVRVLSSERFFNE